MKTFQIMGLFVLILCLSVLALAQNAAATDKRHDDAQAEDEKRAAELLEQIVKDASSLKLPENRVFVFASAADLLWSGDEKRARALFARAAAEISAALGQSGEAEFDLPENFWMLGISRNALLQIVVNRDAELALEILRQTRPPIFNQVLNLPVAKIGLYQNLYSQARNELQMEQDFAARIAKQNPHRALEIARANLKKGASHADLNLIDELKKTDAEAAASFADEVLQKILSTDLSGRDNYNARNMAVAFLSKFSAPPDSAENVSSNKPFRVNAGSLRQLAAKYADYFFTSDFLPYNYHEISSALPTFEKILPERVERLRRKFETLKQNPANSQNLFYEKLNQMNASATPEALLAEVENFPVEMRPQIYSSAASRIAQAGDVRRARQILSSLPAGRNRDEALFQLDWSIFYDYLNKEKFAEAEQIVSQQTERSHKIRFLVEIARRLHTKNQIEKARQFLSDALSMTNSSPEDWREVADMMQVLNVCAAIEPKKAFDLLESFIPKANELFAATALLSKYQQHSQNFREGEFVINSGSRLISFGDRGFYLGFDLTSLNLLAKADLEHAINLANKFERNDVRLAAQLMILRSALDKKNSIHELNGRNYRLSF